MKMEADFPRGLSTSKKLIRKKKLSIKARLKNHVKKKINSNDDNQLVNFVCGTQVLAIVSSIKNFEIYVSLPNSRKGIITISNISNEYTKLLKHYASLETPNLMVNYENLLSLHDIFQIGMTLRCTIIEIDNCKKNSTVKLSINPQILNKDINLRHVPVFTGIISSCEDHGYIVDIGQNNLSAFILLEDSNRYLKQLSNLNIVCPSKFSIGYYLNCLNLSSKSIINNSIKISIDINKLKFPLTSNKVPVSIQNILPGTVLTVKVKQIKESQLIVSCNHFSGLITRIHLLSNWKSYHIDQELSAVLIYIHPIKRTLIFSELKHLSNFFQSENLFSNLSIGDIINNAEVVSIKKFYGVFLKIPGFTRMFAKWSQISTTKNKNINIKKGDFVKCRIVNLNFFDRIVLVSLREDIINQQYFKIDDINIGEVIICQIQKSLSSGLVVSLFQNIKGFVPSMHISNIPLKNPSSKLLPGKKIKCRVMLKDSDAQKLILTHKKLLIKSKYLVPCEYSEVLENKFLTGFVAKTLDYGIVVVFFNNVKGWIPKSELSYQSLESPKNYFFVGQVIDCLVKSYDAKSKNLILTLKSDDSSMSNIQENIFRPGSLIDCRVTKQTDFGLYLKHNETANGFISLSHLSDYSSNCQMLIKLYESNSDIFSLLIIENKNNCLTFTHKKLFINMIQEENFVTDLNQLIIDKLYYGFVKKKMDYGIFIQLNGLTGLLLKKDIIDVPHPDPISLLEEGQTIIGKVKSIDLANKQFLITLRLEGADLNKCPIEYLRDFIVENNCIRERLVEKEEFAFFKKYSIGNLVKFKVNLITNKSILGVIDNNISAFVIKDNFNNIQCEINELYDTIILYIDFITKTVQLSLDKILVKAAKNYSKNKYTNIMPGQVIKSEVQLISNDYILVSLKNHGIGQFAYVPSRKHLSDFIEKFKFDIGQQNDVVIREILSNGQILASLDTHEIEDKNQSLKTVNIGDILIVTVKKVCHNQLNISTARLCGRIHITEIIDELNSTEINIMKKFNVNDRLKVKIIGIRNDNLNYNFLECTIKPSKLIQPLINWPKEVTIDNFQKGDPVIGFITHHTDVGIYLQITRKLKGFVNFLNASESVKVLNNLNYFFPLGMACRAWVLMKNKNILQLSMIENQAKPKIGDVLVGKIIKKFSNHLFLQLPMNNMAYTSFKDKIDNIVDDKFVICKIIKESFSPNKKFIVTLDSKKYNEEVHLNNNNIQINVISSSKEDSIQTTEISNNSNELSNSVNLHATVKQFLNDDHLILPSKFEWYDEERESVIYIEDNAMELDAPATKKLRLTPKLSKLELERVNYEKILHKDPNLSVNWLKYINFELRNNEINKGRRIAERAIKTISFREENEKFNIWNAYMDLESNFGTEETLQKIVQQAMQSCDPFKVQCHLKDIYANSGRLDEAIVICQMIVKRHKQNLDAWSNFATLLYKFGKLQEARELLSDCVQKIDVKDRIDATSRFAQLESKFGVPERGETLLEDIVKNFPKRTDIWSMYADMCIKNGHIDQARQVLERVTNLSLNPKKMKFLFDKYLFFETKYGNDENIQFVKEKAAKFAKK